MKTPHEVLGLEPGASEAEIQRAWRRAAKHAHPDRNGGSTERMQAVNAARDQLLGKGIDLLEQEVKQAMLSLIEVALSEGVADLPKRLRAMCTTAQRNAELMLVSLSAAIVEVQGKRRTYRFKGAGQDLVGEVLDAKVREIEERITTTRKVLDIQSRVVPLLDDYLSPEPPKPPPGYYAPHPSTRVYLDWNR